MSRPQPPPRRSDSHADADGRLGAAISDAMVAVIREAVGRGPKRARTFIHDDVIVCLLLETMTPLERTLHQENREDTLQEVRRVLHNAIAPKASDRVEALTGRTVLAALADHHRDPDAGVLVFLMEAVAQRSVRGKTIPAWRCRVPRQRRL